MGQYQQWLHYREVDRHLQAQLEELLHELAQLQERSTSYEQMLPSPSEEETTAVVPWVNRNAILHALLMSLNGHTPANGHPTEEQFGTFQPSAEIIFSEPEREAGPGSTISAALFAQSNLPNFETHTTQQQTQPGDMAQFTSYLDQQLPPPIPQYDMDLLPEDMAAFFDQHTPTDPQIELPWWLRDNSNTTYGNGPVDQESIRTNRLVERWLQRWGKLPPHLQKPGGPQS